MLATELFARYAAQGVKARDLIHAAVMLNNGVQTIVSTDSHFDQLDGIRRIHPQQFVLNGEELREEVRPHAEDDQPEADQD